MLSSFYVPPSKGIKVLPFSSDILRLLAGGELSEILLAMIDLGIKNIPNVLIPNNHEQNQVFSV